MKNLNDKYVICFLMMALISCQSASAMIIEEEREISRSSRPSWKNMFCCCGPSREEKANHHFKKAMGIWNNTRWDTKPASTAMQEAAYHGHPSAPAMLKNIEEYSPGSKIVNAVVTVVPIGYRIYSFFATGAQK